MTYKDIFGFFDFEDIYDMAVARSKDGDRFLEIGCLLGKSTAYLLQKIKESGKDIKVVVIDTFEGNGETHNENIRKHGGGLSQLKAFVKNILDCGLIDDLTLIDVASSNSLCLPRTLSPLRTGILELEPPKEPILISSVYGDGHFSFIFIDAAHEYDAVKKDLELWYPKLKSGGLFAGHDYYPHTGVPKAISEVIGDVKISKSSWYKIKP